MIRPTVYLRTQITHTTYTHTTHVYSHSLTYLLTMSSDPATTITPSTRSVPSLIPTGADVSAINQTNHNNINQNNIPTLPSLYSLNNPTLTSTIQAAIDHANATPSTSQSLPSQYTLNAPVLPDLKADGTTEAVSSSAAGDTATSSSSTTAKTKPTYRNYSDIDWSAFIPAAQATGNCKLYCHQQGVCYTTFKRRQKHYNSLADKSSFKQFKKATNLGKRSLDETAAEAVRDEFIRGVASGQIPNTNKALMSVMVKHRNATHPGKEPLTKLGNSVIQNFKKQMNIQTLDLNKVQGKNRPAELTAVMSNFAAENGDKYNLAKSAKDDPVVVAAAAAATTQSSGEAAQAVAPDASNQ